MKKDYIDRELLIEELKLAGFGEHNLLEQFIASGVYSIVKSIPTQDVIDILHGRWIEKPYLLGTTNFCSRCGENYGMPHGKFNYCPNCGAKMDGGENEH